MWVNIHTCTYQDFEMNLTPGRFQFKVELKELKLSEIHTHFQVQYLKMQLCFDMIKKSLKKFKINVGVNQQNETYVYFYFHFVEYRGRMFGFCDQYFMFSAEILLEMT